MQATVSSFEELAQVFGLIRPDRTAIPAWEERYIKRIEQMFNAVKKAMLPVRWDDELESFIIERPAPSGYNFKRLLWSEGNEWVFGDEDGNVYASGTSLTPIMERITRWTSAKFSKKGSKL